MKSSSAPSLQLVQTKDGSQTILNETLGSTYHSIHGALTESEHVFVDKGLRKLLENGVTKITLMEMGLGTGLNALLTAIIAAEHNVSIDYHALELYPVPIEIYSDYKLPEELEIHRPIFDRIHHAEWNTKIGVSDSFSVTKHLVSLLNYEPQQKFDLVYFDAFEPDAQPELWTQEVFEKLYSWMNPNGILTTYCCKGYVRRNMLAAGFSVEKVPGPPGKREMIVAIRAL